MDTSPQKTIYSDRVIDFVSLAGRFIDTLIRSGSVKRSVLLEELQRLLPELYVKAIHLPQMQSMLDDSNEKFVTEEEYEQLKEKLTLKFGYLNDYLQVVEPDFSDADGPVPANLAEDMADMYQDLKDFLMLYQIGNEDLMNDALWECQLNFERYWGQKLLNSLGQIHKILNAPEPVQDDENSADTMNSGQRADTDDWFISRRQRDFRDPGE